MTRKTFFSCLNLCEQPRGVFYSGPVFYWQSTCIIYCRAKEAPRRAPDGTIVGSGYKDRFVIGTSHKKFVERSVAKFTKWFEEWKVRSGYSGGGEDARRAQGTTRRAPRWPR